MTEADGARGKPCGDGSTRRDLIAFASLLGLGLGAATCGALPSATAEPADERPKEGDFLVAIDAATPVPLEAKDIAKAEVIAWPFDPTGKVVRSGSRLNKVLLLRLDPATLAGATRERAADGVVAYSAICPHAGCEVDGWSAEQRILECPCHNSRYNPCDGAAVIDGPTPRSLAALPLKIVEGRLVVAKPFTGRVGIAPTQ